MPIMQRQRVRTAAGMGPPITTFAALPSAGSVPGQLRQLSDVNNIIVQSLGGIWRPYGGSQVLAMRVLNPVTIQNLAFVVAETIGPFPGGLVRAGMQLEVVARFSSPAVGVAVRTYHLLCTNNPTAGGTAQNVMIGLDVTDNSVNSSGRLTSALDVANDTSGPHTTGRTGTPSLVQDASMYGTRFLSVDFSQPWYVPIRMMSCAETAVNITGATWSAGVATYTTSAPHTLAVGDKTVIAGITPTGYNVAAGAIVLSVPTTTSFTVAIASDPGAYTSGGTSSRISNMISRSYVLTLKG